MSRSQKTGRHLYLPHTREYTLKVLRRFQTSDRTETGGSTLSLVFGPQNVRYTLWRRESRWCHKDLRTRGVAVHEVVPDGAVATSHARTVRDVDVVAPLQTGSPPLLRAGEREGVQRDRSVVEETVFVFVLVLTDK